MRRLIINFFLITILFLIIVVITISTIGIETNKFNKLISEKLAQTKNINLELNTIRFKLDPKKLSLFLETERPKINYREVLIPAENIKVYLDFISLLKSNLKIKKTNLIIRELDVKQLKKLSVIIKPSNFKSLLNNKVKEGKLISEIEIFLTDKGAIKNFIAKGEVKDLKAEILEDLNFTNTNLNFFADKNDILIKNINGLIDNVKISDGDIKINLENGVKIDSNFNSKINLDEKISSKYLQYINKYGVKEKIKNLKANLNNNLSIILDKTYKVVDYNYSILGEIENSWIELKAPLKNDLIKSEIKNIYFSNFQIKSVLKPKNISLIGEGKYSFNNLDFLSIKLENKLRNKLINFQLDFDYANSFDIDLINYKKSKNSIANLSLDLEKKYDNLNIKKFNYKEKNNKIFIQDLKIKKKNFLSFKKIEVKTQNNDFNVTNDKKILIKGNRLDAKNLIKLFNKKNDNKLKEINSLIEIDFENVKIPMSEKLVKFKVIGEIKQGQFIRISSKGDFGGNNFLEISMKKNRNSNKKYLEIYSDLTRPLLTEYDFFNGLSGGTLLFTSVIENQVSYSKLKIENFKVINAPGVIKLLSLADLGGLKDLVEGEGLSFDILEIAMEKKPNMLVLKEILALGPSMSVLMEGYRSAEGLTSLRGTLVPAKTLNKLISKIPLIGDIVIPKEVGEGLFGISFKMKGPKGKIKTTINPIRTLTPRFIQKIVDRKKTTK